MAYELVNNGPATPLRIHSLLRLVARLENPDRDSVARLLQPEALGVERQAARDTIEAATQLGFLYPPDDQKIGALRLRADVGPFETVTEYRAQMQKRTLGALSEAQPNFLFNLFTAWYATQDENSLSVNIADLTTAFNRQVSLDRNERAFNSTKFSPWRTWSRFLGLCWPLRVGSLDLHVPNAYGRILPLLPALLPQPNQLTEFGAFAANLAQTCPELDGGALFEQCWQASYNGASRGNQLSLMLSNALRQLHDSGTIELVYQADARSRWNLYRATGHPVQQVSHIRRRSN